MTAEELFAGRQSLGRRENQEDSYGFCLFGSGREAALVLALADGMGGHQRGEIASSIAVQTFLERLDPRAPTPRDAMLAALDAANEEIGEENGRRGGGPDEMGTTFVGLFLWRNRLQWVSVGDSPLYLFREGELHRLNEEHVHDDGTANGKEGSAPLMSALTGGKIRMIDAPVEMTWLQEDDIVICASDGLNTIPAARIAAKLEVHGALPAAELAEILIEEVSAERKSSQDNLTVAILKPVPALAQA